MAPDSPLVADSLEQLIAGASDRVQLRPEDARSGATFERLVIDGERYFLKVLSADSDWIMRCTGNTTNWEFQVWKAGLYHRTPSVIDHAMVGMALEGSGSTARLAMLMTDRGADMVPPGDTVLPVATHEQFIDHMAAMHAAFIDWRDDIGLNALAQRFLFFAPETIAPELLVDDVPGPIRVAHEGWARLPERAPRLNAIVEEIHGDAQSLADAMRTTPQTFIAGDWKLGNVGARARRPNSAARLGLSRRGPAVLGPVLVPRAQPGTSPDLQGSNDRVVPRSSPAARCRHHRVVRAPARTDLRRDGRHVCMGEGRRRRRRAAWWEAAAIDGMNWLR